MQRSRLEIKIAILKVALNRERMGQDIKITHLYNGSNIDWKHFQHYLPELIGCGLLMESKLKLRWQTTDNQYASYSLTQKGRDAIRRFDELSEMLSRPIEQVLKSF